MHAADEKDASAGVFAAVWKGMRFEAPRELTLLEAASFAGLDVPSSCRNGTCRTCLARLVAGQVHYRIAWPGLLPEERAQGGWVLPCVAHPESDVVLEAAQ